MTAGAIKCRQEKTNATLGLKKLNNNTRDEEFQVLVLLGSAEAEASKTLKLAKLLTQWIIVEERNVRETLLALAVILR